MGQSAVDNGKYVGPVVRGFDPDLADAMIAAIEEDNPGREVIVDDRGGYIRVSVSQECRLTRASLVDALGRDFALSELEPSLSGFAGRMRLDENEVIWYLERED
ncbi:MAG: MmoB/DmpM family protein [Actinomycetes bacterium]